MTKQKTVREMLAPGRRLDCGHACEVAALLVKNLNIDGELLDFVWYEDA